MSGLEESTYCFGVHIKLFCAKKFHATNLRFFSVFEDLDLSLEVNENKDRLGEFMRMLGETKRALLGGCTNCKFLTFVDLYFR
jgi:hypothetical protein